MPETLSFTVSLKLQHHARRTTEGGRPCRKTLIDCTRSYCHNGCTPRLDATPSKLPCRQSSLGSGLAGGLFGGTRVLLMTYKVLHSISVGLVGVFSGAIFPANIHE